MKRNLAILILMGLLLMPTILLAAIIIPNGTNGTADGTNGTANRATPITTLDDILSLIGTVGDWISAIVLALAITFILVSAFQFLTAAGNPEKISSARNMLIYALVAVAIAAVAWGLPDLVQSLIG